MLQAGEVAPSIAGIEGTPALLVFFKISCPTCQLTLPYLERMFQQGIPVIGISQDDIEMTREFANALHLTFPMRVDERHDGYPASNAFRITTVPSMFLVEADFAISWASMGFVKREIEEFAAKRGVAPFRPGDRVPELKPG